jgi:hypothetical protein
MVSFSLSNSSSSSTCSLVKLADLHPGMGLYSGDDESSLSLLLAEETWGMLLNFSTFWPAYIF